MNTIRNIPPTLAVVVSLMMAMLSTSAAQTNEANALVTDNNVFALDLYAGLKTAPGNLFFSPYSISTCLAMVYAGARGETEQQMAQVLRFSTNQNELHAAFGELQKRLNAVEQNKGIELVVANGLWAQQGHHFLPDFPSLVKQRYEAKLEQVDFATHAEPVRKEINDWVSQKTKGKIPDLIAPGTLNAATRLVLANAIYFKGRWTHPFNPSNTVAAPFYAAGTEKIEARMMNLTAGFKYAEADALQILELAYQGNDVSMVVLLPKDAEALKTLEDALTAARLDYWLSLLRAGKVNVFLPKFKLAGEFSLGPTLADLGMTDAFSPRADFSGMDGARDLYLSAVVHKAFVDVNEEGTEAAAATGAVMSLTSVLVKPIPVFRADHPFIFLIRDVRTGSVLFLGRVANPAGG
jgi:serpin B